MATTACSKCHGSGLVHVRSETETFTQVCFKCRGKGLVEDETPSIDQQTELHRLAELILPAIIHHWPTNPPHASAMAYTFASAFLAEKKTRSPNT